VALMVLVVASSMEVWRRDGDDMFGVLLSCFGWDLVWAGILSGWAVVT